MSRSPIKNKSPPNRLNCGSRSFDNLPRPPEVRLSNRSDKRIRQQSSRIRGVLDASRNVAVRRRR